MASGTPSPAKAWPVQRYSRREGQTWQTVDDGSGSYTLHSNAGQLMLIQNGTILESLSLLNPSQMHAVVKVDTLLMTACLQGAVRKFKIRFLSVQAAQDCKEYLQVFFPIKDITKAEQNVPVSFGQMFQQLLQSTPAECLPTPDTIPAAFPLEETLHMCILDPSFCDLVKRVSDILARFDSSETN